MAAECEVKPTDDKKKPPECYNRRTTSNSNISKCVPSFVTTTLRRGRLQHPPPESSVSRTARSHETKTKTKKYKNVPSLHSPKDQLMMSKSHLQKREKESVQHNKTNKTKIININDSSIAFRNSWGISRQTPTKRRHSRTQAALLFISAAEPRPPPTRPDQSEAGPSVRACPRQQRHYGERGIPIRCEQASGFTPALPNQKRTKKTMQMRSDQASKELASGFSPPPPPLPTTQFRD